MMELFLSSDGKHTVHVTGEGADDLLKSLPHAKMLYEAVVKACGTKGAVRGGTANGTANSGRVQEGEHGEAPMCPVYKTPMAYREGKHGVFWSCPKKLPDGSWCRCTAEAQDASENAIAIV